MRKFDYAIDDNFSFKSWQGVLTESMLREADESEKQSDDFAAARQKYHELEATKGYEQFVDKLDADRSDPKFIEFLNQYYGDKSEFEGALKDCVPEETKLPIKQLQPTQNEIDLGKSTDPATGNDKYWKETIEASLKGDGVKLGSRLIVYAGKYIIDGHHRWSKVYALNPNATMQVYNFPAKSGLTVQDVLKATQLSIVASNSDFELKDVSGDNMLTTDENTLKNTISKKLTPAAEELYGQLNFAKGKDAIAEKLTNNIKVMQQNCQPISGASRRKYMPQTSDKSVQLTQSKGLIDPTP